MKTISIPVNDRPHLLREVLSSIRANSGWRDWRIVFSCEPPVKEVTEQLMIGIHDALTSRNAVKLGCWANTFHAASVAMELGSELNLYLEDDYLISKDALALVDQWSQAVNGGVLCLRRPHEKQDSFLPRIVTPYQSGLFGCGFAWTAQDWPIVRKQWNTVAPMWDIAMEGLPLTQWRPLLNRSHGIGTTGTHSRNGDDLNLFGPAYEGEPVDKFIFLP